jgi:hypothetical protein
VSGSGRSFGRDFALREASGQAFDDAGDKWPTRSQCALEGCTPT